MTTHGTVSSGQILEFGAAIHQQLPRDLPPERLQYWVTHKGLLEKVLRNALEAPWAARNMEKVYAEWNKFYFGTFGKVVSDFAIDIPSTNCLFPIPMFILAGTTYKDMFKACGNANIRIATDIDPDQFDRQGMFRTGDAYDVRYPEVGTTTETYALWTKPMSDSCIKNSSDVYQCTNEDDRSFVERHMSLLEYLMFVLKHKVVDGHLPNVSLRIACIGTLMAIEEYVYGYPVVEFVGNTLKISVVSILSLHENPLQNLSLQEVIF